MLDLEQFVYVDGDYTVSIRARGDEDYVLVVDGSKTITSTVPALTRPEQLPPYYADQISKRGLNPRDYIFFASQIVRAAAGPMLDQFADAYEAETRAKYARRERDLAERIPGLAELRAAYDAEERYRAGFRRMMEDESNDGVRAPTPPAVPAAAVARQYPVAALYLRAEDYSFAANDRKAGAGRRALELLEAGGDPDEAGRILDNWLPDAEMWK